MDPIKLSHIVERAAFADKEAQLAELQRGELSNEQTAALARDPALSPGLVDLFRPLSEKEIGDIVSQATMQHELSAVTGSVEHPVERRTSARTPETTVGTGVEHRTVDDGGTRPGDVETTS